MSDIKTILHDIDAWGDRLIAAGRIDNLACKGVWLKLWGDGSGSVMAEYATDRFVDEVRKAVMATAPTQGESCSSPRKSS